MKEKQFLVIIIIIFFCSSQSVTISNDCTCLKIFTEVECAMKSECSWDTIKKICIVSSTNSSNENGVTYCNQYKVPIECVRSNPCEWNGTSCTHFTGCTAYTFASNDKCQEVSIRCITDGIHCVEIAACSTYRTKTACKVSLDGNYCFWNISDPAKPLCQNTNECSQLPIILNSDALCRNQLVQCTAQASGGCVESGINCEDQVSEIGCVTNKDRTQMCFWASGKCYDKTCDNAVLTLVTDQDCTDFLSSCTTKQGGGCVTRSTCGAAAIQTACVKDNTGADCFWNGNNCVNKTCANALTSNKTNASCQTYLSNCITNGAGCIDNTGCESAKIKDACDKTLNGTQCHWDGTYCKLNTCQNAGPSFVGHDQCTAFMATCTANGVSGCTLRTCLNAPTSNNTNDLCNAYHPTGNCITKNGGGCRVNTTCEEIDIDQACIIDMDGRACFWDGGCRTKTCANSPSSNNSHFLCQQFQSSCTVGIGSTCVEKTCENILAETDCTIDLNNKECSYKGKCYKKQCALASKSITTHVHCQAYLSSCTLDNLGFGCMPIPLICEGITQKNACIINSRGGKCGLEGTLCVDRTCFTTSGDGAQLTTTNACNTYKTGCVVNNNLDGCMDLPLNCAGRKQSDNCEIETVNKICYWDQESLSCKDITCSNITFLSDETINHDVCQAKNQSCTVDKAQQPKGCIPLKACTSYTFADQCKKDENGDPCKFIARIGDTSGTCIYKPCADAYDSILTDDECQQFSSRCTVAQKKCKTKRARCAEYQSEDQCNMHKIMGYCIWDVNQSEPSCKADCRVPIGFLDYDICQSYDQDCTVRLDGILCVEKVSTCSQTDPLNCTSSKEGFCHLVDGVCVLSSNNLLKSNYCSTITGTKLTVSYCKEIGLDGNSCSVNAMQTACTKMQQVCSSYSLINCFYSIAGLCVVANGKCTQFNPNTDSCSNIMIYGIDQYHDYHCQKFKLTCKAKQDGTGCEDLTSYCTQLNGFCFVQPGCQLNLARTNCVPQENYCSDYSVSNCSHAKFEGNCMISENLCIQKSCDSVSVDILSMEKCQDVSSDCIFVLGGCTERSTCASYQFEGACVKNTTGGNCLWNPKGGKCVDKSCSAAENSVYFDTDAECSKAGNCTVKANDDKSIGFGCVFRTACDFYVNSEQCKLNDKGVKCFWVTNDPLNPFCSEKSCKTASILLNDHDSCYKYLTDCTVDTVDINGILTTQGCVALKVCSDYQLEAQCVKSSDKNKEGKYIDCVWNGTVCVDKSCATAQISQNTHKLCNTYLLGCTVNATDNGCVIIPDVCEEMTQNQCFDGSVDSNSRECYWVDEQTSCVTKTCENSPNYLTASECDSYLSGCTTDEIKCKIKICEDYHFTTDAQCNTVLDGGLCTTNGIVCVTRGSCAQAQAKEGCVTDSLSRPCQWMNQTYGNEYCTLRTCNTAPNTYTNEESCQQYYTPSSGSCTTKKDGGCTLKGTCFAATAEAACKTDNNGADCWWDVDKCRLKECKDFSGTTHADCNKIRSNCTVGLNEKCAQMVNCELTKVRAACIIGNNGPCLWISDYIDSNGSKGACFSYESCNSLDWTTDAQCKLISSNCTTDGQKCIGITNCAETNINGGCMTGTDGQCMQTVVAKNSDKIICKKYHSCNSAYFLTHDQCYLANQSCTSDQINGCIPLANCQAYVSEGQCRIDKNGVIVEPNGRITSTGICVWDVTTNTCRNQQCNDIILTNEFECAARLSTCTTNGITCIDKGACDTYTTSNACDNAQGLEGTCFWVITTESCRTKICADIPNGITTSVCSEALNCVSDGTDCIAKAVCASYLTKTGCESQGTDGLCAWTGEVVPITQGKCSQMTGCASAKDEQTCKQASNRCSWKSTTKACVEHSCETYQAQVGYCTYFYTWDMKNYNICQKVQGKCVAIDAATLSEGDCYTLTAYQYSYNPSASRCSQCSKITPIINYTKNENASTNKGNILVLSSIFIVYQFI